MWLLHTYCAQKRTIIPTKHISAIYNRLNIKTLSSLMEAEILFKNSKISSFVTKFYRLVG